MSVSSTTAELRRNLEDLVPLGCRIEVATVGQHTIELSEREQALVAAWGAHRQREFAAGRLCARNALLQAKVDIVDLLPDEDGLPRWPAGVVGSISHSRGIAMAVVTAEAAPALLGLDLEKTNRLSGAAIKRIVHSLEWDFVAGDQVRASILFSLKEAFYKAQFPQWRTVGNFHDLALELDLNAGVATVLKLDARFAAELQHLSFRFRLVDDYVLSLCWL